MDLVLCSTARRARETATGIAAELKPPPPLEFDGGLYAAPGDQLLVRLAKVPADVGTVLVCGHNPAVHEVARRLAGSGVEEFPPAAVAVLDVEGEWSALAPETCRLLALVTPKSLAKP